MLRLLLTRRWLLLLLAVVIVAFCCVRLGKWQFHRYDERHTSNERIRDHLAADPVPIDSVFSTRSAPTDAEEWTSVTVTGTYDPDNQLFVVYRTRDGAPGDEVVVPLVTSTGDAVLVDRGWVPAPANGNATPDVAAPPSGTVTVTGFVRRNSDGGSSQVVPSDGSVRAISSDAIAKTMPYPLYDGFLNLTKEDPAPDDAPSLPEQPDLGSGPSFFYGIQWNFFAMLAVGFYLYFAWAETRALKNPPNPAPTPSKPEQEDADSSVTTPE